MGMIMYNYIFSKTYGVRLVDHWGRWHIIVKLFQTFPLKNK